ncbi:MULTISPECIES: MalY/PatB family protein [unclassified Campylobacter]|uniref:MalY/PatB family protein n=1 Tax=unclassified Campylobacter TaxID=2593542 RepID=UPI0022E9BA02|nr:MULTISPECIES: MalY/PatB family protein [unclassified Campylobacter]MDA3080138.1 pyridoxal phosphate-dependent aminotransferase [Campylobacter sp. CS_NA2]MDA3081641.1 pyridoxal phosphate-dependent aminotransferase [Campylobacter sp. CS_NA1]MDA3086195.1 pyridoxal phosphate-dependent aminotransferase [Campylobacter sp. CS_ED1]MDA3090856.1 pyridoxal phosphate-dependent aminotransferase [Campylobacter sp. CS_ED2]WBR51127.1 pyridoxal phosphate-dependent aminotransferase [Campylobacter sp. CS_NA3]
MKFNFDEIIDRRNLNSLKWAVGKDELPMWVADMDFRAAPCILEALQEVVGHGIFGYSEISTQWALAYQNWWQKRHGFRIEEHWLIFCTGIVPALSSLVRKLTTPNENVLVQSPVYNCFFSSIKNNGVKAFCNELVYENGQYHINWEDFENKLADPQTTLFILCNPHNPIGKIWSRDELAKMGELCAKHGVTVISDEIHCDLCEPGFAYTPFANISETNANISISCISPTKAFNIAGLNSAAVFAKNKFLRHKAWRAFNTDEIAEPNAFAVAATVAAFEKGEEWLDELRIYLSENKKIVREFLSENLPYIRALPCDATYLMWLDCSNLINSSGEIPIATSENLKIPHFAEFKNSTELANFIRSKSGLYLSSGEIYGAGGEKFLRLNIATPRANLLDGLERLKNALSK